MFTAYKDICRHLDSLGLFHMDLTLQRMYTALQNLGLDTVPFPVVQIVGTNGKGSTAAFLASLAQAHGCKVGLYTSPHFVRVEERVRINGVPLPPQCWPELGNAVMDAAEGLTYFEFLTVLALLAFARQQVDVVVMEAGLGGRMDATTACPAHMLCVTPIDRDHEKILGQGMAAIAADKAAAMRVGERVFSADQPPEVVRVLKAEAAAKNARLVFAADTTPLPPAAHLGLWGPHQRGNARLALAAWRVLAEGQGIASIAENELQGLRQAFVPGRLHYCPPRRAETAASQQGTPPALWEHPLGQPPASSSAPSQCGTSVIPASARLQSAPIFAQKSAPSPQPLQSTQSAPPAASSLAPASPPSASLAPPVASPPLASSQQSAQSAPSAFPQPFAPPVQPVSFVSPQPAPLAQPASLQSALPPLLLDGAHNPHGMRALQQALEDMRITPSAVVFSCMEDKDITHILPELCKISENCPLYVVTIAANPRAAQATDLAARINAFGRTGRGGPACAVPSLAEALARCADFVHVPCDRPVLVCGSLYLLGEFFSLYPEYLLPQSTENAHA